MNWVHIAGIAGKATSNLALAYKRLGYFVTGSDNQCLPPATDLLDQYKIPYVSGFTYKHLTKEFWEQTLNLSLDIPIYPQLAVFGSALSVNNKEYKFAKLKEVKIMSFAQAVGEIVAKENSIVSVGTAGKTTTTALLVKAMQSVGLDPSYLIGAELVGGSSALMVTDSIWSVMEGDEYYGVELETHSKFFEYKPKYVLLNKITWDHAGVFKTSEDYQANFARLAQNLPGAGLLLANATDPACVAVAKQAKCRVAYFSAMPVSDQQIPGGFWQLKQLTDNRFTAISPDQIFTLEFEYNLPGIYNQQNALATVALLYELLGKEVDYAKVASALAQFKGIKKRLEIVYASSDLIVVDDLGGPPIKVLAGAAALKERYPNLPIYAIYEPNSGNRVLANIDEYLGAFKDITTVVIPELSELDSELLTADRLVKELQQRGVQNVQHMLLSKAVEYFKSIPGPKVVVFFSSYRLTTTAIAYAKS